jgi:prevent-host-death family protein
VTPPRNNQRACINLADDFDFDGAVAQLARASGWQPEGQGFESPQLHSPEPTAQTPISIGSNPFRNHFGYWMERVARGEEVIVTFRGKPRMRLVPIAPPLLRAA